METVTLERKFKYSGMNLGDPSPALTLEGVKEFWARSYPELTNSVVEGPERSAIALTYTFVKAAGTKGYTDDASATRARLSAMTRPKCHLKDRQKVAELSALANAQSAFAPLLLRLVTSGSRARPLPMPEQAFGLWG